MIPYDVDSPIIEEIEEITRIVQSKFRLAAVIVTCTFLDL